MMKGFIKSKVKLIIMKSIKYVSSCDLKQIPSNSNKVIIVAEIGYYIFMIIVDIVKR